MSFAPDRFARDRIAPLHERVFGIGARQLDPREVGPREVAPGEALAAGMCRQQLGPQPRALFGRQGIRRGSILGREAIGLQDHLVLLADAPDELRVAQVVLDLADVDARRAPLLGHGPELGDLQRPGGLGRPALERPAPLFLQLVEVDAGGLARLADLLLAQHDALLAPALRVGKRLLCALAHREHFLDRARSLERADGRRTVRVRVEPVCDEDGASLVDLARRLGVHVLVRQPLARHELRHLVPGRGRTLQAAPHRRHERPVVEGRDDALLPIETLFESSLVVVEGLGLSEVLAGGVEDGHVGGVVLADRGGAVKDEDSVRGLREEPHRVELHLHLGLKLGAAARAPSHEAAELHARELAVELRMLRVEIAKQELLVPAEEPRQMLVGRGDVEERPVDVLRQPGIELVEPRRVVLARFLHALGPRQVVRHEAGRFGRLPR